MNNKEQDNYSNATLDLIKKFVDSNQRKRINSLSSISKDRNENYKILVYEKFEQLIGSKIILKDLKKIFPVNDWNTLH